LKLLFKSYHVAEQCLSTQGVLWATGDVLRPVWGHRFFDPWRSALRRQRFEPFERFAELVAASWDGVEAHGHGENKVPLGFVEGLNNKIRVIQKRAHGFQHEPYFRLKVLTCTLPKL
jgi:transposase